MKDIIKLFREAGKETVIVGAIAAGAAMYFIHEGVSPGVAIGVSVAAFTLVTVDYLRKAAKANTPYRPTKEALELRKEINEIDERRVKLRKELGIEPK